MCYFNCFQLLVLPKQNLLFTAAAWLCEKCFLTVCETGKGTKNSVQSVETLGERGTVCALGDVLKLAFGNSLLLCRTFFL